MDLLHTYKKFCTYNHNISSHANLNTNTCPSETLWSLHDLGLLDSCKSKNVTKHCIIDTKCSKF